MKITRKLDSLQNIRLHQQRLLKIAIKTGYMKKCGNEIKKAGRNSKLIHEIKKLERNINKVMIRGIGNRKAQQIKQT